MTGGLDSALATVLADRFGAIDGAETAGAGVHNDYTGTVRTSGGAVFVKAARLDQSRLVHAQTAEARIASVVPLAPRLLDHVQRDGWDVLVFEHVPGKHADLRPKSPDLEHLVWVLDELHTALTPPPDISTPSVADQWARLAAWQRLRADPPADLHPWVRTRIDEYADSEPDRLRLLVGDSLAHTDLHALNVLIGNTVHVVDWAWTRTAPAWFDAAMLAFRLVEAGHTPDDARALIRSMKPGQLATDDDLVQLAIQAVGNWEYLARQDDRRPHLHGLAAVARTWVESLTEE